MNKRKVAAIFARFAQERPSPQTELIYHSNFELLIAVILSAQATDISVNKATAKLYTAANTPEKILALGEEKLRDYIRTIGLYKTKAKNVIACCRLLVEQHQSEVPRTRALLEALPGVGRKTANVVLNTCFNEPTIAVDTHIFRVANRIGLAAGDTPLAVETQLDKIIPAQYKMGAHHWLILHGRYTCVARKPKCPTCNIRDLCEFPFKTGVTVDV